MWGKFLSKGNALKEESNRLQKPSMLQDAVLTFKERVALRIVYGVPVARTWACFRLYYG